MTAVISTNVISIKDTHCHCQLTVIESRPPPPPTPFPPPPQTRRPALTPISPADPPAPSPACDIAADPPPSAVQTRADSTRGRVPAHRAWRWCPRRVISTGRVAVLDLEPEGGVVRQLEVARSQERVPDLEEEDGAGVAGEAGAHDEASMVLMIWEGEAPRGARVR